MRSLVKIKPRTEDTRFDCQKTMQQNEQIIERKLPEMDRSTYKEGQYRNSRY